MSIDKNKSREMKASELRREAEKRLGTQMAELLPTRADEETQRLVHELNVHQLELEMQNEELSLTKEELETALEKFTDLYDFAPVGYCTLDRNGIIRTANLASADFLGRQRSRLVGRRFGLLLAKENRVDFAAFLDKVFASEAKQTCEVVIVKEESLPFFVQIEAVACNSRNECRVALIDISEHRRAEGDLAEKKRELEELNRSLETRIVQAVDELRQKDQILILQDRRAVMGEMINNIAHQWRQPLNSLGIFIQQLPLAYEAGDFNEQYLEETSGEAMKVILHMSKTIDDFRNFFRSDKKMVTFGINSVIEHTVYLIEKSFLDQQISIEFTADGYPTHSGYPNEYAQVLLNILMNARDELIMRAVDDARISIHSFELDGKSVVTIADNAGGISEKIIDRLFDPYFTTKGPDKGTGVGLFMSKTIIEKNMGGRLTVRNIGKGAEFRIEV